MNDIQELVFILDRSGSMYNLSNDVIGGFNATMDSQREIEGKAYVTTVLFNNEFELIHDHVDLNEISNLTKCDYVATGTTALYDAIGFTIKHIQKVHSYLRKEDLPSKITCFITTDGYENASTKYSAKEIKNLIKELSSDGKWEFNFLAQGIDSDEYRDKLGLDGDRCYEFNADKAGTITSFACMSKRASLRRKGGK